MQDLGVKVLFSGVNFLRLLKGLGVTAQIAFVAIILATVFGMLFGLIMLSKNSWIRFICRLYLEAIRIIPILVWLFIFYFGVPKLLQVHLDGILVSILVFTLWGTAEMGDIVRGAVTSLPLHQTESGKALGLSNIQIYRYIIIPQALRRLIPAAINLATRMIKTTSLAVLIGVVEVIKVGQQIIEVSILRSPSASLWVYGFIFFLYFIICYPVSIFSKQLETRWQSE